MIRQFMFWVKRQIGMIKFYMYVKQFPESLHFPYQCNACGEAGCSVERRELYESYCCPSCYSGNLRDL